MIEITRTQFEMLMHALRHMEYGLYAVAFAILVHAVIVYWRV